MRRYYLVCGHSVNVREPSHPGIVQETSVSSARLSSASPPTARDSTGSSTQVCSSTQSNSGSTQTNSSVFNPTQSTQINPSVSAQSNSENLSRYKILRKEIRCPRCGCTEIVFEIKSVYDKLENRYAICGDRKVKSRWDLPGFMYRPKEEYDLYFYGKDYKVAKSGQIKITELKPERSMNPCSDAENRP